MFKYHEGESENKSQMDIKRKTYDIQTWQKHFSIYPPTLIAFFLLFGL
jgi:hypothetical protein